MGEAIDLFDSVADTYDEVRPSYPEQLFDDIVTYMGKSAGRVLEIGSGTGQATLAFARRGFDVTALEPGKSLLNVSARKLSSYPNVRLINVSFEEWLLESGVFDAVTSATAFHWVTPSVGYVKAAEALKEGGTLAPFWNKHPRPYTGFFEEVQLIYHEAVPEWPVPDSKLSDDAWIQETKSNIQKSGLFGEVTVRTYPWSRVYQAKDYIRLLSTYSDHMRLEEGRRNRLFRDIQTLIEDRFGGSVIRPYLAVLFLAHKL